MSVVISTVLCYCGSDSEAFFKIMTLPLLGLNPPMGHIILAMLEATQLFSIDSVMILNNQHTLLKK